MLIWLIEFLINGMIDWLVGGWLRECINLDDFCCVYINLLNVNVEDFGVNLLLSFLNGYYYRY